MDTEDKNFVNNFVGYVHGRMKDRASSLKNFFNHTNGKMRGERRKVCYIKEAFQSCFTKANKLTSRTLELTCKYRQATTAQLVLLKVSSLAILSLI